MKRFLSKLRHLLSLGLLLTPTIAFAQNGAISGHVSVSSDRALSGARVQIVGTDRSTSTDRYGDYTLPNVPAGDYQVQFEYLGLENATRPATVRAGELTKLDMAFFDDVYELEPLEVVATSGSEARALNQQRSAVSLTNIVSADAFGRFPDQNAAEALARLPGITVDRDQGEGRYVVIRGADPELTSFSVDGVALAAPKDDQRAVLMDIIPSDVMDTMEVYKVVSPDQPADGIGGYVNIRTPSAFEAGEQVARVSVQGNYSDLVDKWGERINATYGNVFGPNKQFGIMFSASYDERKLGSDNQEADPWEEEDGSWVTESLEYREYNLSRKRTGANINLEYKPNDGSLYYIRANYNHYEDHEYRNREVFDFGDADLVSASNREVLYQGVPEDEEAGEDSLPIKMKNELKDRTEKLSLWGVSIGGEQTRGSWKFDYKLSHSFADEDTPDDYKFEYKAKAEDASVLAYSTSDRYHPRVSLRSGDTNPFDAGEYKFDSAEAADQLVEEKDNTGEINVRRDFDTGNPTFIKFGGLVRLKDKDNDVESHGYEDPSQYKRLSEITGTFDYPFGDYPFISHEITDYFLNNRGDFEKAYRNVEDSYAEDFSSSEDVYAGYVMGGIEAGKHSLRGGVRVEHTRLETEGWAVRISDLEDIQDALEDGENVTYTPADFADRVEADRDYTNVLPGILYHYNVNDRMVLRASATRTIARPNFAQTKAASITEDDEIERGNPDLDPYESTNLDASLEYYMPHLGMLSVAVYYKDIDNFIFEQVAEETINGSDYEVTTFNNGDSADILGIEIGYQQLFTMLPEPFDGLGLLANVSLTDSSATYSFEAGSSRDIELPRQSNVVGNLALTYEKFGFFGRIAASYRSSYLDELGEDSFEDRFVDDSVTLDISTSYRINPNFSVFANFINVTNEPFRAYFRESKRLSQYEEYGMTVQVGAKWTL